MVEVKSFKLITVDGEHTHDLRVVKCGKNKLESGVDK